MTGPDPKPIPPPPPPRSSPSRGVIPPPPRPLPPGDEKEEDDRRGGLLPLLGEASLALGLLLALLLVFLIDRRTPNAGGLYARQATTARIIFDPLLTPIAEVRQHGDRADWIKLYGGSDESEEAVRLGLEWLARHQAADGHWGPDCLHAAPEGRCRADSTCSGGGSNHRIAQTALAILAFQAGGHYDFNDNRYSECVRRGLDWLVANQRPDGYFLDLAKGAATVNMYEHGIASFAIGDACEMAASLSREPDDRYRQAVQKAVRYIEYVQHRDGGWRYTDNRDEPSDTSVSGWQVLALKAARRAKIVELGTSTVEGIERFFKSCEMPRNGKTAYQPGNALSHATTGVGMLVHEFLLDRPESPLVHEASRYLGGEAQAAWAGLRGKKQLFAAKDGEFYTWYNCTLAMFQAGGDSWKQWNDVVRDHVIGGQERDARLCTYGSWDVEGRWSPEGGRVYTTALAALTLEVYYRYTSPRAAVYK